MVAADFGVHVVGMALWKAFLNTDELKIQFLRFTTRILVVQTLVSTRIPENCI
jgi:hypothetical protein